MGGVDTETRPWRTSTGHARWARSTLRRWRSFSVLPASVATPNTFPCYRCCFPWAEWPQAVCAPPQCAALGAGRIDGTGVRLRWRYRRRAGAGACVARASRIRTRGYGLADTDSRVTRAPCGLEHVPSACATPLNAACPLPGQARVSRNDLAYYAREPFFADFVQVGTARTQCHAGRCARGRGGCGLLPGSGAARTCSAVRCATAARRCASARLASVRVCAGAFAGRGPVPDGCESAMSAG